MNKQLAGLAAAVAGLIMLAAPAGASRPEPLVGNPQASCAGLSLSEHAVNDGAGAIAVTIEEVEGAAAAFGFDNAGQIISQFSQARAGTHDPGCEDVFYAILFEGP